MEWMGWQAYRRGLGTNLKELGAQDTTIQCILRHENVSTTQRFYINTPPRVAQEGSITDERNAKNASILENGHVFGHTRVTVQ
jgi:hypothetical protein